MKHCGERNKLRVKASHSSTVWIHKFLHKEPLSRYRIVWEEDSFSVSLYKKAELAW